MKTIFFSIGSSKCFTYLRISLPFKHLQQELYAEGIELVAGILDPKQPVEADAYVFGNLVGLAYYDLVKRLKADGKTIVWQVDDLLTAVPAHNPASKIVDRVAVVVFEECLSLADQIWSTTQPLAIALGHQDKTTVVPNAVDMSDFPSFKQRKRSGVFWAGGQSHSKDLDLVAEAIKTFPDRQFIFQGCLPDSLKCFTRKPFSNTITMSTELPNVGYVGPVAFENFYRVFNTLAQQSGIGIAPLVDDEFNRCKSPLRYLELAAAGLPVICSNVEPFKTTVSDGTDGLFVQHDRWKGHIEWLDSEKGNSIAEAGYNNVKDNWSWQSSKIKNIWTDAITAAAHQPYKFEIH